MEAGDPLGQLDLRVTGLMPRQRALLADGGHQRLQKLFIPAARRHIAPGERVVFFRVALERLDDILDVSRLEQGPQPAPAEILAAYRDADTFRSSKHNTCVSNLKA